MIVRDRQAASAGQGSSLSRAFARIVRVGRAERVMRVVSSRRPLSTLR